MTGRDLPSGFYLATGPEPPTPATETLASVQREVLRGSLERKLDEISETVAAVVDRHRGDRDPAPVELLDALCRAHDAPLTFQSLHRRVDAGGLTWQQIWDTPAEYDDGLRLVGAAVVRQHADALQAVRESDR